LSGLRLDPPVRQPLSGNDQRPSAETLSAFVAEWLPVIRASIRPSTWESYRANLANHVLSRLGGAGLGDLGPTDLNRLYLELLSCGRADGTGGLSAKTVHYVHTIVHRMLRDAVRWGRIERNPASLCDPPRQVRPEISPWGEDEAKRFLLAVKDDPLYALYVLAITTGLRRGELLGLTWASIDLPRARLFVGQSLVVVNYSLELSSPKTRRSRRSVALDEGTVAALTAHRSQSQQAGPGYPGSGRNSGLVFTRDDGSPVHPHSVSQGFDRRIRRLDLPRIRFHDLRHTSATLALSAGIHPKVVSERLGHASVTITLDTYSHVVPTLQEEAAAKIGALVL
ncbi:MAG: site-specific integrase, partial [Actinomycetota bacterium]|nr:site-specific integrase [Actinomycetota bacterium]